MAAPRLSDEILTQTAQAYREHGSEPKAAAALGIPRPTFQCRLQTAAQRGFLGTEPVLPGYAIKKTSRQTGPNGELQKEWVQQGPAPGEKFEVPEGHAIKGVSALLDADGRTVQQWVKTRAEDATSDIISAARDVFSNYRGVAPLIPSPDHCDDDLLTVYNFPDLHIGMLAWAKETGDNYDLNIATQRAREMTADLVSQSRPSGQAVVLGLGDLFHQNDQRNMTPRSGHILDVDGRWPKVLRAGVRLAMDLIEMAAQKHDKVLARFIPGNHDPDATAALNVALSVFYEGNDRIIVDDDPGLHFYYRFGKVLIGASHGHTMKMTAMPMMMATDRPIDWGETIYKHMFSGHIHHERSHEIGPVRVESFNTIASKDAHAHAGGYRAGHALNAITFHKERGEIGRHRVNYVPS